MEGASGITDYYYYYYLVIRKALQTFPH